MRLELGLVGSDLTWARHSYITPRLNQARFGLSLVEMR